MMLRALNNLRIRTRIAIALLLPLAGFTAVSGLVVAEKWATLAEMSDLQTVSGLAARISGMMHELQRERCASSLFLGSKGTRMRDELQQQRKLTNEARRELDKALGGFDAGRFGKEFSGRLQHAITAVGELNGKRQQIEALSIAPSESNAYFTAAIADLLKVTDALGKVSKDAGVTALVNTYASYMRGKEKAGQERANGAPGIAAGKFDPALYVRYTQIVAEQAVFFDAFAASAAEDLRAFERQTVSGKEVEEVLRIRTIVLDGGLSGDLKGVEGPYWYQVTTARIDLMKKVEDRIAATLQSTAQAIRDRAHLAFFTVMGVVLVLLAITVGAGLVIVRGIARPVGAMTGAMSKLAGGDTTVEIAGAEGKDEIGAMARAVLVFKENKIKADALAAQQKAEQEEKERRAATMSAAVAKFEKAIGAVAGAVASAATEMQSSAQSLSTTAEEASRQATAVAAAAEQASSNVQTVATAGEELSSSIAEIGRQVAQSTTIAGKAVDEAKKTDSKVQGLSEAAQKIGDVVKLITDIAAQTNLLALNATIEAARAGEAGKGFAVVASEVKNLANQTAKATEEIGQQIGAIQGATRESVEAIQTIGRTIGEINEIATTIASAVEEQGAATQEIARNVQEAARGTQEVSANVGGVTQASRETGTAATQVLGAAGELAKQSETLRREVDEFLASVRAA
jgi:methyl-accepting chemotaxis protein